jgi:transcriptional regulator with XRE-family HTH domain
MILSGVMSEVNRGNRTATKTKEPDRSRHVREAVRALRTGLGETQPQFANRLEVGIATAVRYELSLAPHGRMLAKLAEIARTNKFPDQAKVFRAALREELGLITLGDLRDPSQEIRRNPVKPPCRPEDLPKVYSEYVKYLTRGGFQTITSVELRFRTSDGKGHVVDVALPEQSPRSLETQRPPNG